MICLLFGWYRSSIVGIVGFFRFSFDLVGIVVCCGRFWFISFFCFCFGSFCFLFGNCWWFVRFVGSSSSSLLIVLLSFVFLCFFDGKIIFFVGVKLEVKCLRECFGNFDENGKYFWCFFVWDVIEKLWYKCDLLLDVNIFFEIIKFFGNGVIGII